MMPSLFWAVLAGAALLAGALVVSLLSARELARTREKLFGVGRLLERTRRLNDAVVEKRRETQPQIIVPTPTGSVEIEVRRPLRLGE